MIRHGQFVRLGEGPLRLLVHRSSDKRRVGLRVSGKRVFAAPLQRGQRIHRDARARSTVVLEAPAHACIPGGGGGDATATTTTTFYIKAAEAEDSVVLAQHLSALAAAAPESAPAAAAAADVPPLGERLCVRNEAFRGWVRAAAADGARKTQRWDEQIVKLLQDQAALFSASTTPQSDQALAAAGAAAEAVKTQQQLAPAGGVGGDVPPELNQQFASFLEGEDVTMPWYTALLEYLEMCRKHGSDEDL